MNALLMAHGAGSRYLPDLSKQMINVGGRPIIRRTCDQLLSRGISDIVVIAPDEFKPIFPYIEVHSFGPSYDEPLLHGVHLSSPLWHHNGTFILLGDVLFSHYSIDWLVTGFGTRFLGRFTPSVVSGKSAPELFALRIDPSDYEDVLHYCRWMTTPERPIRSKPRFWSLLGMMSAKDVEGHDSNRYDTNLIMAINDYTDDVDSLTEYRKFFGPMLRAALMEDENASHS